MLHSEAEYRRNEELVKEHEDKIAARRTRLKEEGWTWTLDAAGGTLVAPEGISIGLASDGTVILASSRSRLLRAQKRDTGEPSRNVARGVFPEVAELTGFSAELAKRLRASSEPGLRPE